MFQVVPDENYSLDASSKEISLFSPFDSIKIESFLKIKNLTTGDEIYSSENMDHEISLSEGVITYSYQNPQHADTDKLQIIVLTNALDGGGA